MALATRCPHCHTTFRVVPDQLKLRSGIVRCGSCQQVFNGIEHLIRGNNSDAPVPRAPSETSPITLPASAPLHVPAHPAPAQPLAHAQDAPQRAAPIPAFARTAAPAPTDSRAHTDTLGHPPAPAHTPAHGHTATDTHQPARAHGQPPTPPHLPAHEPIHEPIQEPVNEAAHAPTHDTSHDASHDTAHEVVPPSPSAPAAAPPAAPEHAKPAQPTLPDHPPATLAREIPPMPETIALPEVLAHARIEPTLNDTTWPDGKTEGSGKTPLEVTVALENLEHAQAASGNDRPSQAHEPDEQNEPDEPSFVKSARRAQKYRGMWLVLQSLMLLLLLALLLAQSLYTWRDLIAVRWPVTRPLLDQGCALLQCKISLPTQISQLSIELGELQALKRSKETYSYTTLIRNAASTRQSWPYIELTLQDENGRPVARKVFEPKTYLLPGELAKGFPAQSEQTVKLYFETSQLKAANFHATIFYP